MDYRSFYHHFENGVYMYQADVIKDVEADFEATLEKSSEDTLASIKKEPWFGKMIGTVGRLIAPMI